MHTPNQLSNVLQNVAPGSAEERAILLTYRAEKARDRHMDEVASEYDGRARQVLAEAGIEIDPEILLNGEASVANADATIIDQLPVDAPLVQGTEQVL
jgi:hypothetical protein